MGKPNSALAKLDNSLRVIWDAAKQHDLGLSPLKETSIQKDQRRFSELLSRKADILAALDLVKKGGAILGDHERCNGLSMPKALKEFGLKWYPEPELIEYAAALGLSPADYMVLCAHLRHQRKWGGHAFPKLSTIEGYTGLSRDTIKRSRAKLSEMGYMRIVKRSSGNQPISSKVDLTGLFAAILALKVEEGVIKIEGAPTHPPRGTDAPT